MRVSWRLLINYFLKAGAVLVLLGSVTRETLPSGHQPGSSPGAAAGEGDRVGPREGRGRAGTPWPPSPVWGGVLTSEDCHERLVCRWRRNQDGAICRKGIKRMLEVLVVRPPRSESWALPGVSRRERPVGPFPQTRPSPRGHRPTVLDSVPGPEGQAGTGHCEEVPFPSAHSVVVKPGSEALVCESLTGARCV